MAALEDLISDDDDTAPADALGTDPAPDPAPDLAEDPDYKVHGGDDNNEESDSEEEPTGPPLEDVPRVIGAPVCLEAEGEDDWALRCDSEDKRPKEAEAVVEWAEI